MTSGSPPPRQTSERQRPAKKLKRKDAKDAKKHKVEIEKVGAIVLGSAINVHRALGPGLLESAYQRCLEYELRNAGLTVKCEVPLPVVYHGIEIEAGYRVDMLVESCVLIENKTVEKILPIHQAQLLTYLRLSDTRLGFLLNWYVPLMKRGIVRMVNNL